MAADSHLPYRYSFYFLYVSKWKHNIYKCGIKKREGDEDEEVTRQRTGTGGEKYADKGTFIEFK